jgi:hypothetical protein
MNLRQVVVLAGWVATGVALVRCGSNSSSPTATATPPAVTLPSPSPIPTPTGPIGLPAGMVCNPTPPPLYRMSIKVHGGESGRLILDSKPLVVSENGYCDKVGFGDWKFCETRPEGHPEREACDYLVTGKATDTGRWGPTWYHDDDACSTVPGVCVNHGSNQFLAIAKDTGEYRACAAEGWPLAANGTRCGTIEIE